MTKVIAAVVGGLLLGGCALPVPVQIASWALDGLSMLTTQKSLTDHGISALAQQDCALWRGVTEGAVCREDDPMAILAEKGDAVGGGDSVAGSSLTSSLRNVVPSSRDDQQPQDIQSSWVMAPESVADAAAADEPATEAVETVRAEAKPAPQWQMVSQEPVTVAPSTDDLASYNAMPGDYLVIGSFGVWNNAKRFAARHPELDAQILAANVADYRVFRIVVGPYNADNQGTLRRSIKDAGVEDIWAVRVPADEITLAWRSSGFATELASIPSAE